MRIFIRKKTKKYCYKHGLSKRVLLDMSGAVLRGECDSNLGGGIYKQRLARLNCGKSRGYRAIVGIANGAAFILHVFAKKDMDNVCPYELIKYQDIVGHLSHVRFEDLSPSEWPEIKRDGKAKKELRKRAPPGGS